MQPRPPEDRPATALHVLGLPPPTELIPIPIALRTDDEVAGAARAERRDPRWVLTRLRRIVRTRARRAIDVLEDAALRSIEALASLTRFVSRRELPPPSWDAEPTRIIDSEVDGHDA